MKPHRTKGSPNPVLLQREHSRITVDRLQVALEVGFVTADKRMCLEEAARKVCALEEELEASRRSMQFLKTTGGGGGGGGGGGSDTSARERAEALEVASRSATEAIAKRDDQMAFLLHRIKELEDANLAAAETLASRDMQIATLVAWSDASRAQLEELRRDLEGERRASEELRRAFPPAQGDKFSAVSPDRAVTAAYADFDDDGCDAHHHLPSTSSGIGAQPLLAAEAAVATHQSASPAQTALSSLELLASIDNEEEEEEEGEEEVLEKKGEKEELGEEVFILGAGEKAGNTFEGKEELQEEQVQQQEKEKEEGGEGVEEDVVVKDAVGIEGEVHDVAEETGGVVEGTPGDGGGGGVEEGEEAERVEEVVVAPRPPPATPVTSASPPPQTPSPAPPPTPPQVHLSFSPKSRVDFKPSHSCTICHRPFGLLRSQRNCRVCEKSVCHDCSPSRVLAVDKSETKARRVCNACVAGLFVPQQQQDPVPSASPLSASSPPPKMDSLR